MGLASQVCMHPLDQISGQIIGAAIDVHKQHGPGLLEKVYVACLGQELVEKGMDVHIGKPIALEHKGLHLDRAFVLDLLVENRVIVEVKSVRKIEEIYRAQLLTYLRMLDLRLGLIINFNVTKLKQGIRRVVNHHVDEQGRLLPFSGANARSIPEDDAEAIARGTGSAEEGEEEPIFPRRR